MYSCIERKGFPFACKSIKMRDPSCAHVQRELLLTGTVCASISLNRAVLYNLELYDNKTLSICGKILDG